MLFDRSDESIRSNNGCGEMLDDWEDGVTFWRKHIILEGICPWHEFSLVWSMRYEIVNFVDSGMKRNSI